MKINIVIDNRSSWYNDWAKKLKQKIKKMNHDCSIYDNQQKVLKNSDITFYLSCEQYITRESRAKSRYNIVIHASDLPRGRGMSPATWQILEGKNKIPVTLFELGDAFDDGNYYLKDSFALNGTELIDEWRKKLDQCIEKMVLKFLKNIKNIKLIEQKGRATTYKRRTPDDSELDTRKSIKSQFNLLRVIDNERYPAFFKHKGNKYILKVYKQKK